MASDQHAVDQSRHLLLIVINLNNLLNSRLGKVIFYLSERFSPLSLRFVIFRQEVLETYIAITTNVHL